MLAVAAKLDRESLAALLRTQPGLRILGEAASAERAVWLCVRHRPAVFIIDTTLLWPGGSCRVADLVTASPRTRVLAIPPRDVNWAASLKSPPSADTLEGEARDGAFECLRLALAEGADGVLRRDSGARELFQAIRALARGRCWVGCDVSLREAEVVPLSHRECTVARLVGEGRSNKAIAEALAISELTVKKHVSHVLRKLQLHDRLQLGLSVTRHPSLFVARRRGESD